jgi:DivIVA domain-containing protein
MLRPDDVTSDGLPVTLRGYDREHVDRLLQRTAEAYDVTLSKNQSQRERLLALEADLAAAEGEAAASSRAVAELMRKTPAADQDQEIQRLQGVLQQAERERDEALADLREASERASTLMGQVEALEYDRRTPGRQAPLASMVAKDTVGGEGEAAELLIAATRAAEDVRLASRARALRTLTKARELATLVRAETDREHEALAASRERRAQAESMAEELLAEANRVDGEIANRRRQLDLEVEERVAAVSQLEAEAQERRAWADREVEERLSEARRVDREVVERLERANRDAEERIAAARRADAEAQERRASAEREAEETLAQARAEAERLVAGVEEERTRMRDLLSGALAMLGTETAPDEDAGRESLVGDLSSRVHESQDPHIHRGE